MLKIVCKVTPIVKKMHGSKQTSHEFDLMDYQWKYWGLLTSDRLKYYYVGICTVSKMHISIVNLDWLNSSVHACNMISYFFQIHDRVGRRLF